MQKKNTAMVSALITFLGFTAISIAACSAELTIMKPGA